MKFKKVGRILGLVVISLAVLGVYLAASYVLGGEYLVRIKGSDTPAFIDRVMQREQNFPKYTFWNYKEGAGVGLNDVYPPLTQTVIVVLSRVSDIGIVSWVKILGFLSIPLFAWGIYLFVLIRLRVWVVGFLGGFFYILSPIAYTWLYGWGFFAESVAMVWFPLFMLVIDGWLKQRLEGKKGFKERIYFGLAGLILALTLLSHPMVFLGSVMFMGVYGVGLGLWSKKKRKERLKKVIGGVAMLFGVAIWLAAFWLVPYQAYNKIAGQGRPPGGRRIEGIYYNDVDWKQVLSFIPQEVMDSDTARHRNFSFPWALAWLLPAGMVMAVVLKRKRLVIAFGAAVLMLSLGLSTEIAWFFARLPILRYFDNWRTLVYPCRVLIPVMAAWGIYGVVYLIVFPFKFIKKRWWLRGIRALIVTGIVLVIAGGWLWYWRHQPGEAEDRINYAREMSDCNVWRTYNPAYCKKGPVGIVTQLQNWEEWRNPLSKVREERVMGLEMERFLREIPGGDFWRMHVTRRGGWARMASPFLSKNTVIHSYDNYSVLMTSLYAVQDVNLYSPDDDTYADNRATPEIANWFGMKYLLLHREKEQADELKKVGFREVGEGIGELALLALEGGEPIVAIDSRPRILVIDRADPDLRIYDLVFRKALFNMVDYDRAMLIHGKEYMTDYTLEELKQFEMVWLYGYEYKGKKEEEKEEDRQKAWGLLDEYVKDGGRLFIDTGWQFTAADWQADKTAEFFPTTDLSWNELGKVREYRLKGDLIEIEGVETERFRPLIWEERDWGVSTGEGLRDWARPILLAKGRPLIAGGDYGKGRVVWSGMNILNHIDGYDWDNEEVKLMKRVVEWLLKGEERDKLEFDKDYLAERVNPDRVEFEFKKGVGEGYGVYFKEAWHPYWRAKLVSGNKEVKLEIYKAGADFKYVFLPEVKVGDKLVLYVKLPWWYKSLRLVSAIGLVGLLVYMFKPEWLPKSWLKKSWRGWKNRLRKVWEDEEE